jgi:hypothetical protein
VPSPAFVMLDGVGSPKSSESFQAAVAALYELAVTLKFMLKKAPVDRVADFTIMPLEGFFGGNAEDGSSFGAEPGTQTWTLMIALLGEITSDLVAAAARELKSRENPLRLGEVRFERFCEGPCVHVLHVGPYAAEQPTIDALHAFAREQGYALHGCHHGIYRGDQRCTAPERLTTGIRHPVRRA